MKTKTIIFPFILIAGIALAQNQRTEHWHERNVLFDQETANTQRVENVFLGNSITEGFDLDKFFPDLEVANRGISGDHLDGLLERLDNSVFKLNPRRLFILIGINDIGRGDTEELILSRYITLLDTVSTISDSTEIYLISILPTTNRWANCPPDKIIRLNNQIENLAGKFGINWLDLYALYVTDDRQLRTDLTSDGLHLNQDGYTIWANYFKRNGILK